MLAEDDSNKLHDMKDIKEELEKLASDLEGITKKKTKLKTVLNILSVLTPRFSQPFNIGIQFNNSLFQTKKPYSL